MILCNGRAGGDRGARRARRGRRNEAGESRRRLVRTRDHQRVLTPHSTISSSQSVSDDSSRVSWSHRLGEMNVTTFARTHVTSNVCTATGESELELSDGGGGSETRIAGRSRRRYRWRLGEPRALAYLARETRHARVGSRHGGCAAREPDGRRLAAHHVPDDVHEQPQHVFPSKRRAQSNGARRRRRERTSDDANEQRAGRKPGAGRWAAVVRAARRAPAAGGEQRPGATSAPNVQLRDRAASARTHHVR